MELLQRIWKDVRRGENIDLYITVVMALFLTLLNVTGIASASAITPLTLAVMAMIAFSILGNRHRLEEILERTLPSGDKVFLQDNPPELVDDLKRAREIWIIGIHLSSVVVRYYSLFKEKLQKGDHIHVLVVDPNGSACAMSAMRYPGKVNPEHERTRARTTLDSLRELKAIALDKLEVRIIDYLLEYSAFLIDPDTNHGAAYISRYTFKKSIAGGNPKTVYRQDDGLWYDHFRTEIRTLWENGIPVDGHKTRGNLTGSKDSSAT